MTHPEIIVSRADHSASEEVASAFVYDVAMIALAEQNTALESQLGQSQQRERIAAEAYNGQQQSYRELETLYQASQERALKAEAELERVRTVAADLIDQYMRYPDGSIAHEFMSAQEDALEYFEDIKWLRAEPMERYWWTATSGREARSE